MKTVNYIVIEGLDGVGKTTLLELLKEDFNDFCFLKNPYFSFTKKLIKIFKNKFIQRLILEFDFFVFYKFVLKDKKAIQDRNYLSCAVYQSNSKEEAEKLFNKFSKRYRNPDYYIYLKGIKRKFLDEFEKRELKEKKEKYEFLISKLDNTIIIENLDFEISYKLLKNIFKNGL